MDFLTLKRNVQRRFGDSAEIFITEADVIDWANGGQLEIARETKCLSIALSQQASTFPINKPTGLIKIERITYNGMPVPYIDIEDLDTRYVDLSLQDQPIVYYTNVNQICLYPDPVNTDTLPVIVTYSRTPATIVINTDALTIPEFLHQDLVSYILIRCHERNENWQAVQILTDAFSKKMALRLEDIYEIDDTFMVIRDDPFDNQVVFNDFY